MNLTVKATGLFFLRMRAYVGTNGRGERAVLLPVVERAQDREGRWISINEMLAAWKGEAALAFFDTHPADLVPGRGLHLELDRLRGEDGAWRANVTSLSLAPLPPSWQRHADASQATPV